MPEHFVPEGIFQKAVIFNRKGQVLLLQASEEYGKMARTWDLPGGKVHIGESLKESLRRELEEETGISPADMQLFDSDIEKFHDGKTRLGLIYFTEINEDVKDLSEEHMAFEWLDAKECQSKKFSFKNAIQWIEKASKLREKIEGR